ncbi:LysR family transcriptional regulator [Aminobacter aminovorans]|uniref:D-malate degradation protein R n=2 Tax=Aminobacter aminovorans TaxID=83263 RepID=A0A380WFA5_AMIAI|nr:LysR family transcriptional regulator [Aminobacter aminovorans]SUU87610.1 D-malate degradation protein R [Aminobacter aminovorans]
MMNGLGAINVFIHAAETRSFVVAGRQLGISASAVGKAVARLEDRLGVRLFHRSTRSITLTSEGSLFLERCRRIAGEFEAAEEELSQARAAPSGPLRVSLPVAGTLLLPVLADFMRAWPEVRLELDFTDRLVDVIEEGFDVVIRTGKAADSRLMSRKLGEFRHLLVASPAYLARAGVPEWPDQLLAHACLHHRHPVTGKLEPWPLLRDGALLELDLPVTAIASSVEARIHLAEQGFGIACLPDYAVRHQLAATTLVPVLEPFLDNCGVMRALWPAGPYLAPKTRALVDIMAGRLFDA